MDSNLIYNRLKDIKNIRSDLELSKFLGVSQSGMSMSRARNTIFWNELIQKCDKAEFVFVVYGDDTFLHGTPNTEELAQMKQVIYNDSESIKAMNSRIAKLDDRIAYLESEIIKRDETIRRMALKEEDKAQKRA